MLNTDASATDATPTVRIGFIRPLMPFQRFVRHSSSHKSHLVSNKLVLVQINVTWWGRTRINSIAAGVEEPEEMTRDTMLHVYYSLETVWVLLQFEALKRTHTRTAISPSNQSSDNYFFVVHIRCPSSLYYDEMEIFQDKHFRVKIQNQKDCCAV
jgi:hypothetical protein